MADGPRFPKFIHVTHVDPGMARAGLCIASTTTAEAAIDSTRKLRVATYELMEVKEGALEPVFSMIVGE